MKRQLLLVLAFLIVPIASILPLGGISSASTPDSPQVKQARTEIRSLWAKNSSQYLGGVITSNWFSITPAESLALANSVLTGLQSIESGLNTTSWPSKARATARKTETKTAALIAKSKGIIANPPAKQSLENQLLAIIISEEDAINKLCAALGAKQFH